LRRLCVVALMALAAVAVPVPAQASAVGRVAADPYAHDPTMIRQGKYYYSFSTGGGLIAGRSEDLLHWTTRDPVFASVPAWIAAELGFTPMDLWAPDISYFDGEYHLYYAASSFGRNDSVIGLATTRSLDSGVWADRGMVLRSRSTDSFNAIDPDVTFDAGGRAWLSFGSFWDGIKMRQLDRETGLPDAGNPTLYSLASRGGASVEGPSIARHGAYYYLFTSLDYCCRGVDSDYRVVVGRSTAVTGPYYDRDGVPLLSGGGSELLRGYNEFRGPGGGDVSGDFYVHHYYDATDGGRPKLSVRRIVWAGGWPALGDPLSGSIRVGHGGAYFTVVDRASGGAVDVPTCGYEGADIRIGTPSASPCQQWRLDDNGSLLNRHSNKVAEVAACVNTDGARVAQWGWLDNDCQKFRLLPTGDGWSRIENRLAGRVLEEAGCGGIGAAVQTWTWLGNYCQQFRLDPVGDILIADSAGRRVLDGCRRDATLARREPGRTCQLWRFTHVTEGYFEIVNSRTGRPLTVDGATEWRIEPQNDGTYRLITPDGRTADLTAADLTAADLTAADLTGADLTGAGVTGADLTGAGVTGADLTGVGVTGADLTGADLTGAGVTGADLTGQAAGQGQAEAADQTAPPTAGAPGASATWSVLLLTP
jgi:hypothetical protein